MSGKALFGDLTGEQLVELIAQQVTTNMRNGVVQARGVEPSTEVMIIADRMAKAGAVAMLAELHRLGMLQPGVGSEP